MEGLLSAISSFFRKKKDDEQLMPTAPVTNPVAAPSATPAVFSTKPPVPLKESANSLFTTIASTLAPVGKAIGDFAQSTGITNALNEVGKQKLFSVTPFTAPAAQLGPTLKDTGQFVADTGKAIVRGVPRGITEVNMSLNNQPDYKPELPVEKFIYGDQPLAAIQSQSRGKGKTEFLEKHGLPGVAAAPLGYGIAAAGTIADLVPFVPESKGGTVVKSGLKEVGEKVGIKSAEELVSVIKNALKIPTTDLNAGAEPVKVAWSAVEDALKNSKVARDLVTKLKAGDLIEGADFVLKRNGDELIANIDNAFKDVLPGIKKAAEIPVAKTEEVVSKGVDFIKKSKKPTVAYVDPNVFAQSLGDAKPGGVKKISSIKFPDYAANNIDRTQVEAVKSSILAGDKINPIVVDAAGNVQDGAHRLVALKELGVKDVDTVVKAPALLPGSTEPLTVKQAERVFKKTGVAPDFVNKQAAEGAAINVPPGGMTGTKTADEGKLVSEQEFNRLNRQADEFLKQDFTVRKAEHDLGIVREQKAQEKSTQKFLNEAEKALSEQDNLISAEGRGGITVPKEIIEAVPKLKDQARVLLNLLNPTRVIEKVAGPASDTFKSFFFDRVKTGATEVQNFLKDTRSAIQTNIIDGMGIKPGSVEDALTFRFGERKLLPPKEIVGMNDAQVYQANLRKLQEVAPQKWQDIVKADQYFRGLYDDLLKRINDTITRFGYDPVLRRNDYYTHYQELGGSFLSALEHLPTSISGMTAYFKPGKQFFKFALPRLGETHTESAIGAVDKYLEPAAYQIFMTENVQRGRQLADTLRDTVTANADTLGSTHLSEFTAWLDNQVNLIAGKKSLSARADEDALGRPVYTIMKNIKNQVSKNLTMGNVSASLTNLIPAFTQIPSQVDKASYIKGLIKATTAPLTEASNYTLDGVQSSFLRRRYDVPRLAPSTLEKVTEKVGWLFHTLDNFSADVAVYSKYYEEVGKGAAPEQAMKVADDFAERILGDRSFGQLPQLFTDQGLKGFLLQFQVEPTNQIANLLHDVPLKEGSKAMVASVIFQVMIYDWLFNNAFESVTGRRPTFDPIDSTLDTVEELRTNDSPGQKSKKILSSWVNTLPLVQIFSGGRVPLFAGFSNVDDAINDPLGAVIRAAGVYGSPVGGGYQVYKTFEGAKSFMQGYETNNQGLIKYPISQDIVNGIKGILFGKYAFPEAGQYFNEEQSPLGVNQTIILKNLLDKDPAKGRQYFDYLQLQRDVQGRIGEIGQLKDRVRLILLDPNTSEEQKQQAYAEYSAKVRELKDSILSDLKSKVPQAKEELSNVASQLDELVTVTPPPGSGTDFISKIKELPTGGGKVKFKVPAIKNPKTRTFKLNGKSLKPAGVQLRKQPAPPEPDLAYSIPRGVSFRPPRLPEVQGRSLRIS